MAETNSANQGKKNKGWLTGFLENSGFLTNDEEIKETSVVKPTLKSTQSSSGNNVSLNSSNMILPNSSPLSGDINPEKIKAALEYFLNLLDKANLPGPDFYEYYMALKDTLQSAGSSINDEKLIYVMVFNTLKSMGLKSDILFQSNQQYIQILDEKYKQFLNENSNRLQSIVGTRQQKITNLENDSAAKQKQIEDLQKQIEANNSESDKINTEIHSETINIEETKNAFDSAYKQIHSELDTIGKKCQQYIK